jgi:hypothetical protein
MRKTTNTYAENDRHCRSPSPGDVESSACYARSRRGRPFCKTTLGRIAAAAFASIGCIVGWTTRAAAYRPFDGTDAAVADLGELEIEFQPAGVVHTTSTTALAGPNAVINYGFADRWELVLQGAPAFPGGAGPSNVPNAALLKYVIQPGVLQDEPGPSVATEFGALLPNIGGSGAGFSWTGIVSQRWQWGAAHINLETNLTPDQHGEVFVDAILEGPNKWTVRPVMEIYADSVVSQSQTYSALVGAIWQVRDSLAFDVGLRYAMVNGRPVNELRAGVTFGFPLDLGRPNSVESPSVMPAARR